MQCQIQRLESVPVRLTNKIPSLSEIHDLARHNVAHNMFGCSEPARPKILKSNQV